MKKSLTKEERISSNNEIQRIFAKGNRVSCYGLNIFWVDNGRAISRMAVTLIKKYGNAVTRNKTKRWIREIYRELKESLQTGYDILFLLFPGEYTFKKRKTQVNSLIKKTGLLIEQPGESHG